MAETWTIGRLISWTKEYFERAGLESPRLCAEILLAHCLGVEKIQLYARFNSEPTDDQRTKFRELVKQAVAKQPIAYLTGSREFYSMDIKVTPAVLIPRAETEMLVDQAIEFMRKRCGAHATQQQYESQIAKSADLDEQPEQGEEPQIAPAAEKVQLSGSIWDVCTGSGCVALAIAANLPGVKVLATDISPQVVEVAADNAETLGLADRVTVLQADLLDLPAAWDGEKTFDVITANPPYVATNDPVDESTKYEPQNALYAGEDGLDILRPLIAAAGERLKPGGIFCTEFGYQQADAVRDLIVATQRLEEPRIFKDFQGIERIAVAKLL